MVDLKRWTYDFESHAIQLQHKAHVWRISSCPDGSFAADLS